MLAPNPAALELLIKRLSRIERELNKISIGKSVFEIVGRLGQRFGQGILKLDGQWLIVG